jgi:ABC-type transport system substrate-binding protein
MVVRQIPDDTTRLAAVKTGEADLAQQFGGLLIDTIRQDPQITIAPVQGISTYVLEFPASSDRTISSTTCGFAARSAWRSIARH